MASATNWTPPKDAVVSETEGWNPPDDAIEETPKKKVPTEPEKVKDGGQDLSIGSKTTQPTSGSKSSQPSKTKVTVGGKEFEVEDPNQPAMTSIEVRDQANKLFKTATPIKPPSVTADEQPIFKNLAPAAVKGNEAVLNAYINQLPFEEKDKLSKTKLDNEKSLELTKQAAGKYVQGLANDIEILKSRGVESDFKVVESQIKEINSLRSQIETDQKAFQSLQETFLNQKGYGDLAKQYAEATSQVRKGEKAIKPIIDERTAIETQIKQFDPFIKDGQFSGTQEQYNQYQSLFQRYDELSQAPELVSYNDAISRANAISGQINKLITPEYQQRANARVSKITDATKRYSDAESSFNQFFTPERRKNIEDYVFLSDEIRNTLTGVEMAEFGNIPFAPMKDVTEKKASIEFIKMLESMPVGAIQAKGYDLVASAYNSIMKSAGDYLSAPARFAGGLSKGYTLSDKVADSITEFFAPKFITTETDVAGGKAPTYLQFFDSENDKINWSRLPNEIANQAGSFTLLALTGMGGRMAGLGDAAAIVLPGTMLSYSDALKTGKELYGENNMGATLYASASSLITGITALIMPDRDILTGTLKKELSEAYVKNFLKGGRSFATKEMIKAFAETVGKEVAEELVDRWKDVLLRGAINVTGGDVDLDVPSVQENLSIIASTAALTGLSGIGGAKATSQNIQKVAAYQAAQNYPETLKQLDALEDSGIDVTDARKKVSDMFYQLKQIPTNLSAPKQIAIAEKMNAIDEIENINASGVSPVIAEIGNKKIKEIQGEIEAIINDPDYDKKFGEAVNAEVENQVKVNGIDKPVLQKFTTPTDEKYGYINRNDGKGDISLTKAEFEKEVLNNNISVSDVNQSSDIYSSVKATAQAFDELRDEEGNLPKEFFDANFLSAEMNVSMTEELTERLMGEGISLTPYLVAQKYHKAKADGSNPEFVEAVEKLLGKPVKPEAVDITTITPENVETIKGDINVFHATPTGQVTTGKEAGIHLGTQVAAETIKTGRNQGKGNVVPMKVSVSNPIILEDMEVWDSNNLLTQLSSGQKFFPITEDQIREIRDADISEKEKQQKVIDLLKKEGYDSVLYKNTSKDAGNYSVVAFDESQLTYTQPTKSQPDAVQIESTKAEGSSQVQQGNIEGAVQETAKEGREKVATEQLVSIKETLPTATAGEVAALIKDGTIPDMIERGVMDDLELMRMVDKLGLPMPQFLLDAKTESFDNEMGYRTEAEDAELLDLINKAQERTGIPMMEEPPQPTKQIEAQVEKAGVKPKNLRDLYRINRDLFGQNRVKAVAGAVVMDRMIGQMAKRAGMTKDAMYGKLEFRKGGDINQLQVDGALFQAKINGENTTLRNIDVDVVNGFYSPLEKIISETKSEKLPVKQWIEKFARGEEAKWTGLQEWLGQQQGSVSKTDILNYLKNNRINVVEVVKEDVNKHEKYVTRTKDKAKDAGLDADFDSEGNLDIYIGRSRITIDELRNEDAINQSIEDYETDRETLLVAKQLIEENKRYLRNIETDSEATTKFSQYQLPGEGNNYKEVLVTLPSKQSTNLSLRDWYEENKISNKKFEDLTESEFDVIGAKWKKARDKGDLGEFRSSHFDEPNILVHLRMNTRTDADGNKVLFLEEVQSDWGQKGKKEGFKEAAKIEVKKDIYGKGKDGYVANEMIYPTREEAERSLRLHGIPSAPFVMDTNDWVKLALKVALKEAVKQGAAKIAWTTGEQQNERYDLSKTIEQVIVIGKNENDGNSKRVTLIPKKGETINMNVSDNGDILTGDYKGNKLEDVIGKELAEKVISSNDDKRTSFKGEELRVGGKGMKGFYGSIEDGSKGIIGGVAEKVFGQKVGTTEIIESKGATKFGTQTIEQPSVTITPELRSQVMSGLPLFQGQQGAMLAQDGNFIIYALTDPNISTPLHELAHVFEHYLTDAERATVLKAAGTESWTTKTSEYFARGFEKYLADGIAPVKELQKIFDKFKEWLTDIYNGITASEIDIKLNKPMQDLYAKMIAEPSQAERIEQPIKTIQNETKNGKGETGVNETGISDKETEAKPLKARPGRGRTKKSNRKIKDPRYLKALSYEVFDPYDQVLQYFINGGTINSKAIEEIFGSKREKDKGVTAERNVRIGLLSKDDPSVKALAEIMASNQTQEGLYTDQEFREAVEDVILSHNSRLSMVDELIERYEGDTSFEEMNAMRSGMTKEESEAFDEYLMAEDYFDSLSQVEKDALIANQTDEEYVRQEAEKVLEWERQNKVSEAKQMISDGLQNLLSKIGGIKNLTQQERTSIIDDLKQIIQGTIQLTGISIQDAVNELMAQLKGSNVPNMTEQDLGIIEKALLPPQTPPSTAKTRKKAVETRAYLGATKEGIESKIIDYGLDYPIENQMEAKAIAEKFMSEVGDEAALDAVRTGKIQGGQGAFIYAKAIDNILAQINATTDIDEKMRLVAKQDGLLDELGWSARYKGQFNAALAAVYETSDFPYELNTIMNDLNVLNKGVELSDDVRLKVTELTAKLKEVNDEIQRQKDIVAELEAKIAFDKIKESIVEEQLKKLKPSDKAKKLADKVREGKINKPKMFMAATPASIAWDLAVEVFALTIEAGGAIADAAQKGLEAFRNSAWYKNATADERAQGEGYLGDYYDSYKNEDVSDDATSQPSVDEDGKIQIPFSLIRKLVTDGVNSIEELTEIIHGMLSNEYDGITDRMVRDAITGYGKAKFPSKDEILKKIAEMRRDGQLLSGLEDVLSGSAPKKTGLQRRKPTDKQRELMRKIKDEMKNLPVEAEEAERRWATANDRIKTLLENRIKDLNTQIAKGEREVRNTNKTELNDDNKALKAEVERLNRVLDDLVGKKTLTHEQRVANAIKAIERSREELQRQIDQNDIAFKTRATLSDPRIDAAREEVKRLRELREQMRDEQGLAEARRVELYKKRIAKDIAVMSKMIAEGKYDKKQRKEPIEADNALRKLQAERQVLKDKIDEEVEKIRLKNRSVKEKSFDVASDVLNIPRTMVASADLSAPLRQGAILGARHPIIAGRAFTESVKWAFSEKSANDYVAAIKSSPEYIVMKQAGLYLSIPTSKLSAKEEQFMSNLAKRIPIWGKIIGATERSYVGYLNKLRVDVFMDFWAELEREGYKGKELNDNLKSFAGFINNASGRGSFPSQIEQMTPALGGIFFAPRFVASRFNVLWRVISLGYGMPKAARIETLKTLGSFIGLGAVILAIAAAAGADVEDDPTSSDFGKIKIGNMRIDIWAGEVQVVTLLARIFLGRYTKTTTGEQVPYNTGGYNDKTYADVIGDFFESKLSPPSNIALEFGRGEYKYDKKFFGMQEIPFTDIKLGERGDKPDITSTVLGNLSPIWQQDIAEIYRNEGVFSAAGGGAASFFGFGMQYYEPGVKDKMQVEAYNLFEANPKTDPSTIKSKFIKLVKKNKYDEDEDYTDKKATEAFRTARVLYNIKNSPEWYKDAFYTQDKERKLKLIVSNTKDMSKSELLGVAKDLKNKKVISNDFYNEELLPSIK